MAVLVIDALEMVDVAEHHAQLFARGTGGAVFALEHGFEGAAVWQAGQVVFLGGAAGFVIPL